MDDSAAQRTLERYLYDYMVKKNMDQTAEIFRREANLCFDPTLPPLVDAPEGFLHEWWTIFHDMFRSRMEAHEEHREEDDSVLVMLQTEEATKIGNGKQSYQASSSRQQERNGKLMGSLVARASADIASIYLSDSMPAEEMILGDNK